MHTQAQTAPATRKDDDLMLLRTAALALSLLVPAMLAKPAAAQTAIGDTGLTIGGTLGFQSDYLFRGISQTRSRVAGQGSLELSHSSGFYIGTFISNIDFLGYTPRAEVDALAGFRFTALNTNFDLGVSWYTYHNFNRQAGQFPINYFEFIGKATHEVGPVTLAGQIAISPNYFGSSGTGVYIEGGGDWNTGVFGLMVGARVGYQWIERNPRFGTPDYANWNIVLSRPIDLGSFGTVTAAVGYYDTNIGRADCGGGQNICRARALGSLTWKF